MHHRIFQQLIVVHLSFMEEQLIYLIVIIIIIIIIKTKMTKEIEPISILYRKCSTIKFINHPIISEENKNMNYQDHGEWLMFKDFQAGSWEQENCKISNPERNN